MNETILKFFHKGEASEQIDNQLYSKYDVKKGLRNEDGTGVLVGLTKIADVVGYERIDGKKQDRDGILYYRGIDIMEMTAMHHDRVNGYEELCFLLLFGYLPKMQELQDFSMVLHENRELPKDFLESNLLREPAKNLMNKLQQSLLMLYAYDEDPDDASVAHTLMQGISLVSKIPVIIAYSYHAKRHYFDHQSLIIHHVDTSLSMAESMLYLLRENTLYTKEEAKILDLMLMLHADHGGGNNSTFTNVVISSTGTDLYSSFVGSIGAMKGPKHGGANIEAAHMMKAVIDEIGIHGGDDEIRDVIYRLLDRDFYDHSGLIYGMGHAVYTRSDPRAEILKQQAVSLAQEKGRLEEFQFYLRFETFAREIIATQKGKHVCANIDFYSGLIYDMLGICEELYTPMFVAARTIGWLAHNIEHKRYDGRIIRPATKYVGDIKEYTAMEGRDEKCRK